jgi:hypothetical protein
MKKYMSWLIAVLVLSTISLGEGWSEQGIYTKANTALPATSLISCDKVVGKKLGIGAACSTAVKAIEPENMTGLQVSAVEEYTVSVPGTQTWHDASHSNTPPCGEPGSFLMNIASVLKKSKKSLWFSLIAEIKGGSKIYDLCLNKNFVAAEDGELVLYANDARGFYKNNSGEILVEIYRNK